MQSIVNNLELTVSEKTKEMLHAAEEMERTKTGCALSSIRLQRRFTE